MSTDPSDNFQIPQGWLPPPSEPGVIASFCGWHLVRLLGMGGMGIVFLARSKQDSTSRVAIKLLRPELQTNGYAVTKFRQETRLVSRMNHPNILRAQQSEEAFGLQFFVMPYMEGGNLTEYIHKQTLDAKAIRQLMIQMAGALSYCHARGIIHRDVKPSNILFDKNGHPYLTDFGLASTAASDSFFDPATSRPRGTAAYLSPKMASGEMDDTRGDIYSLGAVLYEMLAGQPPYTGSSTEAILEKIRQAPPAPLQNINPQSDPSLAAIAHKAMARDIKDRYAEMGEMEKDLEGRIPKTSSTTPSTRKDRHRKNNESTHFNWQNDNKKFALFVILLCGLIPLFLHLLKPKLILVSDTSPISNIPWNKGHLGIWNLNEKSQIFHYSLPTGQLTVINEDGMLYAERKIDSKDYEKFQMLPPSNIFDDRRDELIFRWNDKETAGFSIYNQSSTEIKHISLEGSPVFSMEHPAFQEALIQLKQSGVATEGKEEEILNGILTGGKTYRNEVLWHGVYDVDLDGREEIIVSLNAGYELKPRKLVCMDLETGAIKWEESSGPMLRRTFVKTRETENKPALIAVVGDAPDNGAIGPDGLSDAAPHLYLIDGTGKRLWNRKLKKEPQAYVEPMIADLDSDTVPEIIAAVTRPAHNTDFFEFGLIKLFKEDGALIKERPFPRSFTEGLVIGNHPDSEDKKTIGVITNDSKFFILDEKLESVREVIIGRNSNRQHAAQVICFDDLNGDLQKEWLILTCEKELVSDFNGKGQDKPPTAYKRSQILLTVVNTDGTIATQETVHSQYDHDFGYKVEVANSAPGQPKDIYFMGHDLKKYQFR